jgi:ribosomal protein S18 acetylase RimI-like enzyme
MRTTEIRKRGGGMANQASGAEDPVDAQLRPEFRDAEMLKEAMRRAISTSPEAFLTTIDDLDDKEADYWAWEIRSSTWAVIQSGDRVVGLAVARWPDGEKDRDVDPTAARFIESVWIDPKFRGNRLAERLLGFLFEEELTRSPGVGRFLLWVFDENDYAKRLYGRMGFKHVGQKEIPELSGRLELRYEYSLEPDPGEGESALSAWQNDLNTEGLVYRLLGGNAE